MEENTSQSGRNIQRQAKAEKMTRLTQNAQINQLRSILHIIQNEILFIGYWPDFPVVGNVGLSDITDNPTKTEMGTDFPRSTTGQELSFKSWGLKVAFRLNGHLFLNSTLTL